MHDISNHVFTRRTLATSFLSPNEAILCLTNFPLLGADDCFFPSFKPTPDAGSSRSLFIPQEAITKHARFP